MFWVTKRLGVGPYPGSADVPTLLNGGVTHVLNVGSVPGQSEEHFVEQVWEPIEDLKRIPEETAGRCLNVLHRMLTEPEGIDSRVYVHCAAGQNRSPTILWLYLVALGSSPKEAGERISASSLDALPGHPALVDDALVSFAGDLGLRCFLPLKRPDILAPASKLLIG